MEKSKRIGLYRGDYRDPAKAIIKPTAIDKGKNPTAHFKKEEP